MGVGAILDSLYLVFFAPPRELCCMFIFILCIFILCIWILCVLVLPHSQSRHARTQKPVASLHIKYPPFITAFDHNLLSPWPIRNKMCDALNKLVVPAVTAEQIEAMKKLFADADLHTREQVNIDSSCSLIINLLYIVCNAPRQSVLTHWVFWQLVSR